MLAITAILQQINFKASKNENEDALMPLRLTFTILDNFIKVQFPGGNNMKTMLFIVLLALGSAVYGFEGNHTGFTDPKPMTVYVATNQTHARDLARVKYLLGLHPKVTETRDCLITEFEENCNFQTEALWVNKVGAHVKLLFGEDGFLVKVISSGLTGYGDEGAE